MNLNLFKKKSNKQGQKALGPVAGYGAGNNGWWPIIFEPFAGAWQRNKELKRETILSCHAVFACISLIASDISKMELELVRHTDGIKKPVKNTDYPVIEKPNRFQNRIQFFENWINSKLIRGNAYILKRRNSKDKVVELMVLAPDLVMPLVSDSGEVFYQLSADNLAGIEESYIVPASEIIHDRFNCIFHPLVGISPIYASNLAAYSNVQIQENNAKLFKNQSRPSAILTAPGTITDETAKKLKERWEANQAGDNIGRLAVLGDDLKYQPISMTAEETQMVEQLKLSSDIVCSAFKVPKYKVLGDPPSYDNIDALNTSYYSDCLQILIESIEKLLDTGLDVKEGFNFQFNLNGLLRMDSTALYEANSKAVGGGWMKPDEARKRANLEPVKGGDTPYLQQQNFSLEALAKRDASEDPFAKTSQAGQNNRESENERQLLEFAMHIDKELEGIDYAS